VRVQGSTRKWNYAVSSTDAQRGEQVRTGVERRSCNRRVTERKIDRSVFCLVDRYGLVSTDCLSHEAVSRIVRDRRAAAGFDPAGYSDHGLRAGFATSATRAGVSTFKIRQQTGHASDAMLSRYVRDGELFLGNAAGILL